MLELGQIHKKALKLWDNQAILRSVLTKDEHFPLYISLPIISSSVIGTNFILIRNKIQTFLEDIKKYNVEVQFKEIKHRQLGVQRLPEKICFVTIDDWLHFINKRKDYITFCKTVSYILDQVPELYQWLVSNTEKVLPHKNNWPHLIRVYNYFKDNPFPNQYIRSLAIEGVDTKFIEENKGILTELLDNVFLGSVNSTRMITDNRKHSFEMRFGLKYSEALIRFRLLDLNLAYDQNKWYNRISDFSIPLSQFIHLDIPCDKIFITENKLNGLAFPNVSNAIIIFGLGYGIQTIKNIEWLSNKEIIYWGDIDTHGFAILSQLRGYYPQVKSILMDMETLMAFKNLWVSEPVASHCVIELPNLTSTENELYQMLVTNQLGNNVRLEQERVSFTYLIDVLVDICGGLL